MKHTMKQALALFIAVLLATLGPVSALSDGVDLDQNVIGSLEPPVKEADPIELGDLQQDDGGLSLSGGLTLSLDELPEDSDAQKVVFELGEGETETPAAQAAEPGSPFDQSVTLGDAVITVAAGAGVFPEGAALRVEAVSSEAAVRAVEAAVGA